MSRETIVVQAAHLTGLEAEYTAMTDDGIAFINDGKTIIHVKNTAVADAEITVKTPAKYSGLELEDLIVLVEDEMFIGPFLPRDFSNPDHTVQVDTDTADTTLIAAIRVG